MMRTLASCFAVSLAPAAFGQNATFFWQFSTDSGSTWTANSLTIASATPTTILARGLVHWTPFGLTNAFAGAAFDAFVERSGSYGDFDGVSNVLIRVGTGGMNSRSYIHVFDMPQLLKIDDEVDAQLPGLGSRWLQTGQAIGIDQDYSNPLSLISFSYTLDGTPGTRLFSAAFGTSSDGSSVSIYEAPETIHRLPTEIQPGTITVIPAPTPLAAIAIVGALTMSRRRRVSEAVQLVEVGL